MKIYELLNNASLKLLKTHKSRNLSFNEAETILLSIICKSKEYLYQNLKKEIDNETALKFLKKIKKRTDGYPLQYLTKNEFFYGRNFIIKKGVFIPRPDTETLIESIKKLGIKKPMDCIDIGCGCGCLGITMKLEFPYIKNLTLIDKNKIAIYITKKNLKLYDLKAKVYHASFFNYIRKKIKKFGIAICNPPYIPHESYKNLQREVKQEPRNSLLAGNDGYGFYIKLSANGNKFLVPGGYLILEAGDNMANNIKKIFKDNWNFIFGTNDFHNIERCLVFQLRY
jgi:release factor glutamine methyltransferase